LSNEKWFVYEWSNSSGSPDIIAWCETRRQAERELESAVALANRTLAFGDKERIIGTEYAICHIKKEKVFESPSEQKEA